MPHLLPKDSTPEFGPPSPGRHGKSPVVMTSGKPGRLVFSSDMSTNLDDPPGFQTALEASLQRLQQALLHALMDAGIVKPGPTSIGRRLGLDKSIAWKIGRIAKASSPLASFNFLPGQAGTRILLDAFRQASVDERICEELEKSFLKVEDDVLHHAGDRATAKAMVQGVLSSGDESLLDEILRRDHFRTSKAIWGAQARVQLKADFLAPGELPGSIDTVGFEGLVDLLRMRPGSSWNLARKRLFKKTGPDLKVAFEALDPDFSSGGQAPLFVEYCSQTRLAVSTYEDQEGFQNFQLDPGHIGRTGLVTCLIATMCRNALTLEPGDEFNSILTGAHLRTPCELMVQDLFFHKSIAPKSPPEIGIFGQMNLGATVPSFSEMQRLPIALNLESLPARPGGAALLEVPSHSKAVLDAVNIARSRLVKEHWHIEDFVGYRVRLTFPPNPTFFSIKSELPHG
jgi:hypothetical protein